MIRFYIAFLEFIHGAYSSAGWSASLIRMRSVVRVHVGPPFNWGCSSAGRAIPLHGIGRRFDPCQLHKNLNFRYLTIWKLTRKVSQLFCDTFNLYHLNLILSDVDNH